MSQFRQTPTYEQPVMSQQNTSAVWYRFFQASDTGQPPSAELAVTVTASPFSYAAPRKGFVLITGGTVSAIAITRVGTYVTGLTSGLFPVAQKDILKITYSVKPTVTFFST